jgi:hypothetical protein
MEALNGTVYPFGGLCNECGPFSSVHRVEFDGLLTSRRLPDLRVIEGGAQGLRRR